MKSFVSVVTLHRTPIALVQESRNVCLTGHLIELFKVVRSNLVPRYGYLSKFSMF
jgi:hypothetical protein